jgi:hypothetical protein
MTSSEISKHVREVPEKNRIVLIVWGILESHGPLLPTAHDSHFAALAADKVALELYEKHGTQPIIFDGWKDVGTRSATWEFPGSIGFHSSRVPVMLEIFEQTIERMVREGFTNIFIVNGDGGNWMNLAYTLFWNSDVIRHLKKEKGLKLDGDNWDQYMKPGESAAYLHGGVHSHALATWACRHAPEFERFSALRHGLRAPDESKLASIENDQGFLEDIPHRQNDWSTYPGQDLKRSVTEFKYDQYMKLLYDLKGVPLAEGGIGADFNAKIGNLAERVRRMMQ